MPGTIEFMTRAASVQPADAIAWPGDERSLALVNERFARRELELGELFFFPGVLSSQQVDSHGTRMHSSTLERFLASVNGPQGIPLMNSHRTGGLFEATELNLGLFFWADIEGAFLPDDQPYDDESGAEFQVAAYMLRDVQISDTPNNDLIRNIDAGINRSMSKGFAVRRQYGGRLDCSICGRDYTAREPDGDGEYCKHYAHVEYDSGRCFAWVKNGELVEGSLVYKGSNSDALIRKAKAGVESGELSPSQISDLEDRMHVRLSATSISIPGKKSDPADEGQDRQKSNAGNGENNTEVLSMDREMILNRVAELLGDDARKALESFEDAGELLRAAFNLFGTRLDGDAKKIEGIEARAELGDKYLADLVADATAARVQVEGEEFDAERYSEILENTRDVDYIKGEIDTWQKRAEAELEPGAKTRLKTKNGKRPRVRVCSYQ